jgi:hypothetical protein
MTTPLQHTSLGELGGYNPLLATSLGELGDGLVPTEPEVIHPMGADPNWMARRAKILREDDEILALIMAFMEIKD